MRNVQTAGEASGYLAAREPATEPTRTPLLSARSVVEIGLTLLREVATLVPLGTGQPEQRHATTLARLSPRA